MSIHIFQKYCVCSNAILHRELQVLLGISHQPFTDQVPVRPYVVS